MRSGCSTAARMQAGPLWNSPYSAARSSLGRVHDRDEIGRSLRDPVVVVTEVPVGDAATALVEHHHARELPEPAQELRLHREIPLVLEVRRLTLRHHEGDHPVAEDLVREMRTVAGLRVAGPWRLADARLPYLHRFVVFPLPAELIQPAGCSGSAAGCCRGRNAA